MKEFWREFRSFAVKGNAFDLAVAVVIGNAFSAVINSLVGDIITPFLGLITNHVDLKTLSWQPYSGLVLNYGTFLQALINFFVIALSIFFIFKLVTIARKRIFERGKEAEMPKHDKPQDVQLLEEIRDILRGNEQNPRT